MEDNLTPLLFVLKTVAVIGHISEGWFWELHFDTNDYVYKIECDHYFPDPIETNNHLEQFCKKNEITISKKEWD